MCINNDLGVLFIALHASSGLLIFNVPGMQVLRGCKISPIRSRTGNQPSSKNRKWGLRTASYCIHQLVFM